MEKRSVSFDLYSPPLGDFDDHLPKPRGEVVMSRRGRSVEVQRFPDVSLDRWKGLVLDHWSEHYSTICKPDTAASQLKAVRKVCKNDCHFLLSG